MNTELERICNANNLAAAWKQAKKETAWKESVQRYEVNLLQNIYEAQDKIRRDTYCPRALVEFTIHERGHARCIKAQHISDRVIQRSVTDNVLLPAVRNKLVYDNGASMKGKGLSFSRSRFCVHLRKAYKHWGTDCYMLTMDFSKFFDNLRHDVALQMIKPLISPAEYQFVAQMISGFAIDVSYMTEKEYAGCMERVFNSLDYHIPRAQRTGKKLMAKSMSIGNHISQVFGIFYPTPLDNYFKVVQGFKYYGRYMDDIYIIHNDKEKLRRAYQGAKEVCKQLGLFINEQKTHIKPLRAGAQFLKTNIRFTATGKMIKRPHANLWQRERRRLFKFKKLLVARTTTLLDIFNCYKAWRGTYRKRDSKKKMYKMDQYFNKLFKEDIDNECRRNANKSKRTGNKNRLFAVRPV